MPVLARAGQALCTLEERSLCLKEGQMGVMGVGEGISSYAVVSSYLPYYILGIGNTY